MTRKILTAALATVALAAPATASADYFGAKLTKQIQPSNAGDGHPCIMGQPGQCTRVSMDAYNNAGGERAHKDGVIDKVKLIAQVDGKFRLQIAKARANQEKAKVVRQGPKIEFDGQQGGGQTYDVETFNVNVPVKQGEYLAIKGGKTSMLRCSSGGPNQLIFQPALAVGGSFLPATETDGCWLLLQAIYE